MFDRFNWFTFDPALFHEDPSSRLAKVKHLGNEWSAWTSASRQYRDRFEKGDEDAIFEFARRAKGAFLAPWVIATMRGWQVEGTASGKKKVRKLVSAWLDSRGKQRPEDLFKMIRRDVKIFTEVLERIEVGGMTAESAVAAVAEARHMAEDSVREVYKEYSQLRKMLFRNNDQQVLAYLRTADPAVVWDRVIEQVDQEQAALFLYLEVQSMIREGRVRFGDVHPGWPTPGVFFDSVVDESPQGQTLTLSVSRSQISDEAAISPALAPGDYLRVDVYTGSPGSAQAPGKTFFWERMDGHFLNIAPAPGSPWYEDLKKITSSQ